MNKNEQFIADTVKRRRAEIGGTGQLQFIEEHGNLIGKSALTFAETQGRLPKTVSSRAKFAKAFDWPPDACDLLERGETPEPLAVSSNLSQAHLSAIRLARDILDSVLRGEDQEP